MKFKNLRNLTYSMMLLSSVAGADCVITGCNNELCSDVAQGRVGICEWKVEYQCYQQFGTCAADANGNCAWVETPELVECLSRLQQQLEGQSIEPPAPFSGQ